MKKTKKIAIRMETLRSLNGIAGGEDQATGSLESACWTHCASQSCTYPPNATCNACTDGTCNGCTLITF